MWLNPIFMVVMMCYGFCSQECVFCGNLCGACVQCNYARCQNMYHPMCALLSGARFHISSWSNNAKHMSISCKGHAHKHDKVSIALVLFTLAVCASYWWNWRLFVSEFSIDTECCVCMWYHLDKVNNRNLISYCTLIFPSVDLSSCCFSKLIAHIGKGCVFASVKFFLRFYVQSKCRLVSVMCVHFAGCTVYSVLFYFHGLLDRVF